MTKKYTLEDLQVFAHNPFLDYKSDKIFDNLFIDTFSKSAKHLIKYLIYKQTFTGEKFLFKLDEFNRLMKYIRMPDPSDGLAELCAKEVLAKTKEVHVYWVNKDIFNTGVFEPHYIG